MKKKEQWRENLVEAIGFYGYRQEPDTDRKLQKYPSL